MTNSKKCVVQVRLEAYSAQFWEGRYVSQLWDCIAQLS